MDHWTTIRALRSLFRVLTLMLIAVSCISCGDTPSDSLVLADWKTLLAKDVTCGESVRFTDARVMDKSVDGPTASIRLIVTGDWIGATDCTFKEGPCTEFRKEHGSQQKVVKTMIYEKTDAAWQFKQLG